MQMPGHNHFFRESIRPGAWLSPRLDSLCAGSRRLRFRCSALQVLRIRLQGVCKSTAALAWVEFCTLPCRLAGVFSGFARVFLLPADLLPYFVAARGIDRAGPAGSALAYEASIRARLHGWLVPLVQQGLVCPLPLSRVRRPHVAWLPFVADLPAAAPPLELLRERAGRLVCVRSSSWRAAQRDPDPS